MSDSRWITKEKLAEHLIPLLERYEVKWRGHGVIYVDHQHENVNVAEKILYQLSRTLEVPTDQVRVSLVEYGWLKDVRFALPIRNETAPASGDDEIWTDSEEDLSKVDEDHERE